MSGRLVDRYPSITVFEQLLEEARMNAETDHAEGFVKDVRIKYGQWGGTMYWSDAQEKYLRRIASGDEPREVMSHGRRR